MRRTASALVLTACLAWAAPRVAAEEWFGGTFAAAGLTPASSWEAILKTPRIYARFPLVPFGGTLVAMPLVCVRGDVLEAVGRNLQAPATAAPPRDLVSVYRMPWGYLLNNAPTFLFLKPWELQPCPPR